MIKNESFCRFTLKGQPSENLVPFFDIPGGMRHTPMALYVYRASNKNAYKPTPIFELTSLKEICIDYLFTTFIFQVSVLHLS